MLTSTDNLSLICLCTPSPKKVMKAEKQCKAERRLILDEFEAKMNSLVKETKQRIKDAYLSSSLSLPPSRPINRDRKIRNGHPDLTTKDKMKIYTKILSKDNTRRN